MPLAALQRPPNLHYVSVYDSQDFGPPILPDRQPDPECVFQVEEVPLEETLEDSPDEIEEESPAEEEPAEPVEIPEEKPEEIPELEEIPEEEEPAEPVEIPEEKPEEIPELEEIPEEEEPAEPVKIPEEKPEEIPELEEIPEEEELAEPVKIPEEKPEEIPSEEEPAEPVEIPEEKLEETPAKETPAEEESNDEAQAELVAKIDANKTRLRKMDEVDFKNRMATAQTHPKFTVYVLEMHGSGKLEDEVDLLAYWEAWLDFYETHLKRLEAERVKEEEEEEVPVEPPKDGYVLRNSDQRRLRQEKQDQNRDKNKGRKRNNETKQDANPRKERKKAEPADAETEAPKDAKKRKPEPVEKEDQETYKKLLSHTQLRSVYVVSIGGCVLYVFCVLTFFELRKNHWEKSSRFKICLRKSHVSF